MASITIRNLDDGLKQRLRLRAAEHGRSIEEEVREILRLVVGEPVPPTNLATAIRSRIVAFGNRPRIVFELHAFKVMPKRWIVERSFAWLDKNRRLWKNCERWLNTSLQFVHLAFLALLLRRS